MARAGRAYPNRPIIARHPTNHGRQVDLGPFETFSEWPTITVDTPNANIHLGPFETASEWPPLDLSYEQRFTLAAFETVSEWPPLTVDVPVLPGDSITGDYQIEYGGLLFGGHGNRYQILAGTVEGWDDLPSLDSGNITRPTRHGSWPGRRLAQERQVSATVAINASSSDDFNGLLSTLRQAMVPLDDETETPLVISTRGEMLLAYGAVDARVMPTGDYHQGWVPVAIRWTCSDPRRYNPDRSGARVPVGTQVTVSNAGNVVTHPLVRIDGPAVNPTIANATTGRTLSFLVTLVGGQRLEIDADAGTVVINGDNAMSTLTGSSAPPADFVLARGSNTLTYSVGDGGSAGAVLLYRDAWI